MKLGVLATGDFWAGLALILVGGVWIRESQEIFVPLVMTDMLGPRTFPYGLGVGLCLVGVMITLRVLLRGGPGADVGRLDVLAVLAAACLVYMFAFLPLGYILSTTLFLAFLFFYLGERRHWVTVVAAIGITLGLYFSFHNLLIVDLPAGPFGF